ncbi:MAG: hypothetical protein ABFS30_15280 [Pseudomonadota bacterium]
MMPIVDGLEVEFSGEIEVVRLDGAAPADERLALSLGLRGHPSFAILDAEGRVASRLYGPQPADVLRSAMAEVR